MLSAFATILTCLVVGAALAYLLGGFDKE